MIITERLELIPASVELTRAALAGSEVLGTKVGAAVPTTWPPEYLDSAALEFLLAQLAENGGVADWWFYFVVLPRGATGRTLIGSTGYKGPPSPDGTVEVGYGIVSDQRRHGFASEAVRALVRRAFRVSVVRRVIAKTFPELAGSIGVLRKCGFHRIDGGSEPGVIRYELTRDENGSR